MHVSFDSPVSARIAAEFTAVWAKNVSRLAERTGWTKKHAADEAHMSGWAFWMWVEYRHLDDCGYDFDKYARKHVRCFIDRRDATDSEIMALLRKAHTIGAAQDAYESVLELERVANTYNMDPHLLLNAAIQ